MAEEQCQNPVVPSPDDEVEDRLTVWDCFLNPPQGSREPEREDLTDYTLANGHEVRTYRGVFIGTPPVERTVHPFR